MKLRSITTKFILVVSILMALILAIQLYFSHQTHNELIAELNRLNNSINITTDSFFYEQFNSQKGFTVIDSLAHFNWHPNSKTERVESTATLIKSFPGKISSTQLKRFPFAGKGGISVGRDTLFAQRLKNSFNNKIKSKNMWETGENIFSIKEDSLFTVYHNKGNEIIEVNLNEFIVAERKENTALKVGNKSQTLFFKNRPKNEAVLSFNFPAITRRDSALKTIRYNYSTAEISGLLNILAERNLFISLGLFLLSLLIIYLIAKKFLQPISRLNTSFDKVERGELSIMRVPSGNDEVVELTRNFNQMVTSLKKNKDKEQMLKQQERLASLGQLAAGVAHEIKNPLNAINLTIEHLSDKFLTHKNVQAEAYIKTIQQEIKRLDITVNNFLGFIRDESVEIKPCNIHLLIDSVLHLYEREIKAQQIKLTTKYNGPDLLEVDEERFKTVIMNLLINAIQAIEEPNGHITIKTKKEPARLIVSDNGVGIEDKALQNIFDLYYTTKSAGSGLGLPTVYKIVEAHSGKIEIKSQPQQGTVVTITLPQK